MAILSLTGQNMYGGMGALGPPYLKTLAVALCTMNKVILEDNLKDEDNQRNEEDHKYTCNPIIKTPLKIMVIRILIV